jgi:uncharacterized membrane protein
MFAGLRRSFSDRRIAAVASLGILSLFVVALIVFRILYTSSPEHAGIAWNLLLAWIPFALALVVYDRVRSGVTTPALAAAGVLWLLFLPNAPYIVTDLKHVRSGGPVPVLYDVMLLSAAAWTGLLLGLASLYLMHSVARRLVGAATGWALVMGALALSSFGIYLGRVQRWNSWDVFVRPGPLLDALASGALDPLSHPRPIALTILFTSFLLASYLVFYSLARLNSLVDDWPSAR